MNSLSFSSISPILLPFFNPEITILQNLSQSFVGILLDKFKDKMEVQAKIRYSAEPKDAIIYLNKDNTLTVKFKEKVRAVTPGQAIVFYIGDILVGGGMIITK